MIVFLRGFLRDREGATVVEYGLIAALISIAAVAAWSALGTELQNTFSFVQEELANAQN